MPTILAHVLADASCLSDRDLYELCVKLNTLLHDRKVKAQREALREAEAKHCEHSKRRVISQWNTSREWYCEECGVTWIEDSSG